MVQAQFSDDGTSITVQFSSAGSASSGLLDADNATSGSGPGACTSILNTGSVESLGSGATCKFVNIA